MAGKASSQVSQPQDSIQLRLTADFYLLFTFALGYLPTAIRSSSPGTVVVTQPHMPNGQKLLRTSAAL